MKGIRKSMIIKDQFQAQADAKKSMIQEEKDITDNIKTYLSRADQFAVRMSTAIRASKVGKKSTMHGGHGTPEQNELFVDQQNINLTKT